MKRSPPSIPSSNLAPAKFFLKKKKTDRPPDQAYRNPATRGGFAQAGGQPPSLAPQLL